MSSTQQLQPLLLLWLYVWALQQGLEQHLLLPVAL
jgi:hypothetical protein